MTLIREAVLRSQVTAEAGLNLVQLAERGPAGDPVLRNTLVDGQTGAGSGVPNERSDGQLGSVPLGSRRYMVWYERFVEVPSTSLDRWTVIGPCEIHGTQGTDQAMLMPELSPNRTIGGVVGRVRRMNMNAGRPSARYFDLAPVELLRLGIWYANTLLIDYFNDSRGMVEWRRAKVGSPLVLAARVAGQAMTVETARGYWKLANYRNASINGRCIYDVSSIRIYDAVEGDFYPSSLSGGGGGGGTLPPPVTPSVPAITRPASQRIGVSAGSGVFQPSEPDSKRVVTIIPDKRYRWLGTGILVRGRNTGSGTQVHTGIAHALGSDGKPAALVGKTLDVATAFNAAPVWVEAMRTNLPEVIFERGVPIAVGHLSGANGVTEYGTPAGSLFWATDLSADGPAATWLGQAPGEFDSGSDSAKGLDLYLIVEEVTTAPAAVQVDFRPKPVIRLGLSYGSPVVIPKPQVLWRTIVPDDIAEALRTISRYGPVRATPFERLPDGSAGRELIELPDGSLVLKPIPSEGA